ncbi:hypothetical protein [Riemerella columbina]|uniref:hypothetical protein n=1 Tax=Riemerella columbina TaxID=103810 RepID=UPI00266EB020|nr:hypothetical protein [Riemerella columbina]WKS95804.1 RHS repeat protein [Riemerella columbina]
MKPILLLALLYCFGLMKAQFSDDFNENNLHGYQLKGLVKTVKQTRILHHDATDESEEMILEFNANGQLLKKTEISTQGKTRTTKYFYQGNRVKLEISGDPELRYYLYDQNGRPRLITETTYAGMQWVYLYDAEGRVAKIKIYNIRNNVSVLMSPEFKYNAQGQLISQIDHTDYTQTPQSRSEYQYNAEGLVSQETAYPMTVEDGEPRFFDPTTFTYKYQYQPESSPGNWSKLTISQNGNPINTLLREYTYYQK